MSTINNELNGLKISEMIEAVEIRNDDLIPIVQDAFNKKVTYDQVINDLDIPRLTSNLDNNNEYIAASANAANQLYNRVIQLQSAINVINQEINNINQEISSIVNDGNLSVNWSNVIGRPTTEELRGPQGIQGIQGIQGPIGPVGPQGPQGPKGIDGVDGRDGINGLDGEATFFHVKYSVNSNGNPMTDIPSKYIGTVVTNNRIPPSNYQAYTWFEWEGAQGPNGNQGIPGVNGADGKTSYLHIKYGIGFDENNRMIFTGNYGEDPGPWIGLYTNQEPIDSNDPDSYTWSYSKGEQGEHGRDGTNYEYIFKLTATIAPRPDTPANSQVDDYVPVGWSDDPIGVTEINPYLWCSKREKNNGVWSDFTQPVIWARWSKDGSQGIAGAITMYMGVYDNNTTYIGNERIRHIVKWNNGLGDFFYILKPTAGDILGINPSNALYWEAFQGQYKNLATEFLFAEGANIAGWIFHNDGTNDMLRSQNNSAILNGTTGAVSFMSGKVGGWVVDSNALISPATNNLNLVLDSNNKQIYIENKITTLPYKNMVLGEVSTYPGNDQGLVFLYDNNVSSDGWRRYRTKIDKDGFFTRYSLSNNKPYENYVNDYDYYGFNIKRYNSSNGNILAYLRVSTYSSSPDDATPFGRGDININIKGLPLSTSDSLSLNDVYVDTNGFLKIKIS